MNRNRFSAEHMERQIALRIEKGNGCDSSTTSRIGFASISARIFSLKPIVEISSVFSIHPILTSASPCFPTVAEIRSRHSRSVEK